MCNKFWIANSKNISRCAATVRERERERERARACPKKVCWQGVVAFVAGEGD